MVSTLVVTLGNSGEALIEATNHIIGGSNTLGCYCVGWNVDLEEAKSELGAAIRKIDRGDGVLLLTDMFGGTSTNISLSFYSPNRVEVITGVNLPMVVKALTLPRNISVADASAVLRNQARKAIYIASEVL